jgi:hypothetical protein
MATLSGISQAILDKFNGFNEAVKAVENPMTTKTPINALISQYGDLKTALGSIISGQATIQQTLSDHQTNELDSAIFFLNLQSIQDTVTMVLDHIDNIAIPMAQKYTFNEIESFMNQVTALIQKINSVYIPQHKTVTNMDLSMISNSTSNISAFLNNISKLSEMQDLVTKLKNSVNIINSANATFVSTSPMSTIQNSLNSVYAELQNVVSYFPEIVYQCYNIISSYINTIVSQINQAKADLIAHEYQTGSIPTANDVYTSSLSDHMTYYSNLNSFKEFCIYSMTTFITTNTSVLDEDTLATFSKSAGKYMQQLVEDVQVTGASISQSILDIENFLSKIINTLSSFL